MFKSFKIKGKAELSLRTKFVLYFFLLVLIPFIVFGAFTYQRSRDILESNVYSMTMQNIMQITANTDSLLNSMESLLSYSVLINSSSNGTLYQIYSSFDASELDILKKIQYNRELGQVWSFIKTTGSLNQFGIRQAYYLFKGFAYNITDPHMLSPTEEKNFFGEDYAVENWYVEAMKNNGKVYLLGTNRPGARLQEDKTVVTMAVSLMDTVTRTKLGVLLIDFDYSSLNDMIVTKDQYQYPGSKLFIVDRQNTVMYSQDPEMVLRNLDIDTTNGSSGGKPAIIHYNNSEMYLLSNTSNRWPWTIVNLIPIDEVLKDTWFIQRMLVTGAIIYLFVVLFLTFAVSTNLLKPISKLVTAMSEVKKGNLDIRVKIKSHDEIAFMAESFNEMAAGMGNLIRNVYQAEIRQREAELKSLQSQINPHFLYNTLDSIRGAAITNGMDNIASMTKSMADMLRYSISENNIVAVKDEMNHSIDYLNILNFRHKDKFILHCDVPDELLELKMIRLLLQPLVENAVKHGLETRIGQGHINIQVTRDEDAMKITVSDDGPGMSADKLQQLNRLLQNNDEAQGSISGSVSGIGLKNVNSRIKLFYGMQYGVGFLDSQSGATVEITLPILD